MLTILYMIAGIVMLSKHCRTIILKDRKEATQKGRAACNG